MRLRQVVYGVPVPAPSRILGPVLAALFAVVLGATALPAAGSSAPVAARAAGPAYRCVLDAFGQTADGRIQFRRVVNTRIEVSRSTRSPVGWRPISWGLVSASSAPSWETTRQIVASTDGRVRLVETRWSAGSSLSVRVLKVLAEGLPSRLVSFDDRFLYWVAADRSLQRMRWNEKRFLRPVTVPLSIRGATAMTAHMTDRGMRIYYTTRAGALHVVAVKGAGSTDTVLRAKGYGAVTGAKAGVCMSRDYTEVRPYVGLMFAERSTGVARFQRALHPAAADAGTVTKPLRIARSDWTWRRLG